jgi:hypothetical protein
VLTYFVHPYLASWRHVCAVRPTRPTTPDGGKSNGKPYAAELEFFAQVNPSDPESKYEVKPRSIQFHIIKADKEAEFWPRLLKDKGKEKGQVQLDWSRYVDEDEAEGGFDMSQFGAGASVRSAAASDLDVLSSA